MRARVARDVHAFAGFLMLFANFLPSPRLRIDRFASLVRLPSYRSLCYGDIDVKPKLLKKEVHLVSIFIGNFSQIRDLPPRHFDMTGRKRNVQQ